MKKLLNKVTLGLTLITIFLNATIYEDAEDGTIARWSIYDNTPTGATISNVTDSEHGRVIHFEGNGIEDNGFVNGQYPWLPKAWNNTTEKILKWSIKSSKFFLVFVNIQTDDGFRFLLYAPIDYDTAWLHGLGTSTKDGAWHTFSRNLEEDLTDINPNLTLSSVNGIFIRGASFSMDDIILTSDNSSEECNTNVDSTILNLAKALHPEDFLFHQPTIEKIPLTQGDTFFFKLGGFGDLNARVYRVNCKDHSNIDELFFEVYGNHLNYIGSIGDVAYFNNHHDGSNYGIPFSITEGETLQRIPFIETFLSERGLSLFFGGLSIVHDKLELSTVNYNNHPSNEYKTYIFSPDGTLLGSR